MTNTLKYEQVETKIIELRSKNVIIDSDVAELYGVETKRINEAVKNNPEKFPKNYLIELTQEEWQSLKSKFSTSIKGGKVKRPTAFTEQSLYMLATILKGTKATETTLAIIDTFTKVREVTRIINQLPTVPQNSPKYQQLMKKTGDLISDLVVPDELAETESSIELNLAIVKFKYTLKKKGNKKK